MRGVVIRSRQAARRGFTLIEMLIVVALIAGMAAMIVAGSGMTSGARLRGAATMIISGVRLGISRANSTGRATRMVFDLDAKTVSLEETTGRMLIDTRDEADPSAGAEGPSSAEREALQEARGILDGPRTPRARFSPVAAFFASGGDPTTGRELGRGVRYLAVQTEHDEEARVDGRAYLYFWPGGSTERAVIQLARDEDPDGLSVMVSGLTGRAKIERGLVPFEQRGGADENFGVREEEE
ncbi:MAG TPA: prepilin-type N-terminal cleavage/methylation domain-containing protein [Polyangiaceae bacterium]|jgi:general secretion pathway protein H|nr:prepilin-type N-terminal cleavage/methylation domain-containing protein [Polyangiaceae bacterium]